MIISRTTTSLTAGALIVGLFALAVTLIWWIVVLRKHGSMKQTPTLLRVTGWCLLAFSLGLLAISPFLRFVRVVEHLSSSGSN